MCKIRAQSDLRYDIHTTDIYIYIYIYICIWSMEYLRQAHLCGDVTVTHHKVFSRSASVALRLSAKETNT